MEVKYYNQFTCTNGRGLSIRPRRLMVTLFVVKESYKAVSPSVISVIDELVQDLSLNAYFSEQINVQIRLYINMSA